MTPECCNMYQCWIVSTEELKRKELQSVDTRTVSLEGFTPYLCPRFGPESRPDRQVGIGDAKTTERLRCGTWSVAPSVLI